MTERIIEIAETAAFLSLENQLLKIHIAGKDDVTVPVADIACLLLANPAVTITGALLSALAENGASVVVCGKNRLPQALQIPLEGNCFQNERFRFQAEASLPLKKRLWQTVIKEKIKNQGKLLKKSYQNDFGLLKLAEQVRSGDPDNLEGRAAVIYWKQLFSRPFIRDREKSDNNLLLNYGYAILRAMSARACCAAGLHPTLGINHHNRYNAFCLADDLMEPFRPIIDAEVREINPGNGAIVELSRDFRQRLIGSLLGKILTSQGERGVCDTLNRTAHLVAESFATGENKLTY